MVHIFWSFEPRVNINWSFRLVLCNSVMIHYDSNNRSYKNWYQSTIIFWHVQNHSFTGTGFVFLIVLVCLFLSFRGSSEITIECYHRYRYHRLSVTCSLSQSTHHMHIYSILHMSLMLFLSKLVWFYFRNKMLWICRAHSTSSYIPCFCTFTKLSYVANVLLLASVLLLLLRDDSAQLVREAQSGLAPPPATRPAHYTSWCSSDAACSGGCEVCCQLPYHAKTGTSSCDSSLISFDVRVAVTA